MVTQFPPLPRFEPEPRFVDRVDGAIDGDEVLRYLGYPQGVAPNARISTIVNRWIDEASCLATPRAVYRVLPVIEKDRKSLRVESDRGVTEFRGAIGDYLGAAMSVAPFIATAGPRIEGRASELLREGDELGAMVLNAIGAERAEAAERAVADQVRELARTVGMAPTLPYSPGYCGMRLVEQKKLFSLFDTQYVGVTLSAECLMRPLKSLSGLIGLGKASEVVESGSPCDRCELTNCNMRR